MESTRNPGAFYYYDTITGATHTELPGESKEWAKRESTRMPGAFYWYNTITQTALGYDPDGMDPLPHGWVRLTSASNGNKYFFQNSQKNITVLEHPTTKKQWVSVPEPWEVKWSTDGKRPRFVNNKTDEETEYHPITGKLLVPA